MIVAKRAAPAMDLRTVDLPFKLQLFGVTDQQFDDLADEDIKAELLDGVMTVHSAASVRHEDLVVFLIGLLRGFAEEREVGEVFGSNTLVRLRPGRRFAPDLYFLRPARMPRPAPQQFDGVPEMVAEVLSPSNRDDDLGRKRSAYREAGVSEIWLVDPVEQRILIDRKRRKNFVTETVSRGRVESTTVSGFWLDAAWLWADPPPKLLHCLRTNLK
jgi:Uma2 family endonuclease